MYDGSYTDCSFSVRQADLACCHRIGVDEAMAMTHQGVSVASTAEEAQQVVWILCTDSRPEPARMCHIYEE